MIGPITSFAPPPFAGSSNGVSPGAPSNNPQSSTSGPQGAAGSSSFGPAIIGPPPFGSTASKDANAPGSAANGKSSAPSSASGSSPGSPGQKLTADQQAEVAKLAEIDRHVRQHEAAHQAAGGGLTGAAHFSYVTGPDGRQYAVGGEVSISIPSVSAKNPQASMAELRQVIASALAPADPSGQDRAVAAEASAELAQAEAEATKQPAVPGGKPPPGANGQNGQTTPAGQTGQPAQTGQTPQADQTPQVGQTGPTNETGQSKHGDRGPPADNGGTGGPVPLPPIISGAPQAGAPNSTPSTSPGLPGVVAYQQTGGHGDNGRGRAVSIQA